ncbi:MAG TPA: FAD-dependent oxidoreductase [Gaiellaceae bacterium]|nr:FAD-dependent oxidoreductase [Gaiellaceae bacterium]
MAIDVDAQLLIAGGGLTSARAVEAYREAGGEGRVLLVTADRHPPYHRPPLSKRYLRGEADADSVFVKPESFWADNDVELLLERRVERVDPGGHSVTLDDGTLLRYGKLLVATGSRPLRLPVPGAELEGVRVLRTLDDSTALKEAAAAADPAVVVGASFIGSEVSASLTQLGVAVSLVHRGSGPFDLLGCPELTAYLVELFRERGVELVLGDVVARFTGNGHVEAAETEGGRRLEASLVVQGVGVAPNTELLVGSGVGVDNGVLVDERFASDAPDVYAAGDVANVLDPRTHRRRRVEHWSNANFQGAEVGKVLAGADGSADTIPTFFSEVFGLTFRVVAETPADAEVELRGAFADRAATALFRDGGRIVGAILVGRSDEELERVRDAVREGARDVEG